MATIRHSLQRIVCRGRSALALIHSRNASNDNIIRCPHPDVQIPEQSIPDYIIERIAPYGKKVAFECSVTGRRYTFDQIRIKSKNLNRALRKKLKLQQDDIVAILLPNVPEFPIAILGVLSAGLRATTMNPIYTADEIKKQFKDAGAKAIITLTQLHTVVKTALGAEQIPIITIHDQQGVATPEGAINFAELTDNELDMKDIHIDDNNKIAVMPYSSGTTGLPKGVLLSHRNILSNLAQFGAPGYSIIDDATDAHQDVVPAVLPMFHIYGFSAICLSSLRSGAKIVTMPRFAPDLYLNILKDHRPTVLMAVPPIVLFLYSHPAVTKELLDSVRVLMCGAAPLGALDEQKFRDKVQRPIHVAQGYGLSESSPVVIMMPGKKVNKPGSVGIVMPNTTAKVMPVDAPNGEALGPNQTGELYVQGPQVMHGYHNRPKETAETLVDGWLRTGDMFYYDNDGFFYITDRIKELIKVKGFQVPPAELEEILRDYPGVGDAAVIGVPHKTHGEVPRAYVVAKPDVKLDQNKMDEFVSAKVAEYKRIRGGIAVVDSIPKNPSGKILRRQLKLRYEAEGI